MQNFPPRLSVSIVLHHTPLTLLAGTLDSLQRSAEAAHSAQQLAGVALTLVDNSADPAYRRQLEPWLAARQLPDFFRLMHSTMPGNSGFGAGHNHCMHHLDSDIHLVLNPDVELQVDTLGIGLQALAQHPEVVLLSPRVSGGDGRQEFLCKRYPTVLALVVRGFLPEPLRRPFRRQLAHYEMRDACRAGEPVAVPLASGCFMLVRSAALRQVGGFDERYFLYFEDFDLSLRLAPLGRLLYYPAMQIVHHGGYAASKGLRHVRYFVRAGITFFNRHGWRWI